MKECDEVLNAKLRFQSAQDIQAAALFHLQGVYRIGSPSAIELARAAFVSSAEAVADAMLELLGIRLRFEEGICPVTRRRL